jgi:hypothetical protein
MQRVAQYLFASPVRADIPRREAGANILLLNIIGAVLGIIFLGVGIGFYANSILSAKSQTSSGVVMHIVTEMQQYNDDNGSYPGTVGSWTVPSTFFANTTYFGAAPTDPTSPSTANPFQVYLYDSGAHFMIEDMVAQPSATLAGYYQSSFNGTTVVKGSLCGNTSCHNLIYTDVFGMMAE